MGLIKFISEVLSDEYTDERGYKRFKSNDKLVHRDVAEKKLRRKLWPGAVVHHRDGTKTNNSPDNLWVCRDQNEHDKIHKRKAKKYGWRWSYMGSKKKKSFWDLF